MRGRWPCLTARRAGGHELDIAAPEQLVCMKGQANKPDRRHSTEAEREGCRSTFRQHMSGDTTASTMPTLTTFRPSVTRVSPSRKPRVCVGNPDAWVSFGKGTSCRDGA